MKTLLDSAGSNPDNAVTALKYTATVGAVDKEVM